MFELLDRVELWWGTPLLPAGAVEAIGDAITRGSTVNQFWGDVLADITRYQLSAISFPRPTGGVADHTD